MPAFSMTTLMMSQDTKCTKGAGLPHDFRMSCGCLALQKSTINNINRKATALDWIVFTLEYLLKKNLVLIFNASCSLDIAGSLQTAIMVHLLLILNAALISCIHGTSLLPTFPTRGELFSSLFFFVGATVSTLAVRLRKC